MPAQSSISLQAKFLSRYGASLGGIARATKLSKSQIIKISTHAANTRWNKGK